MCGCGTEAPLLIWRSNTEVYNFRGCIFQIGDFFGVFFGSTSPDVEHKYRIAQVRGCASHAGDFLWCIYEAQYQILGRNT